MNGVNEARAYAQTAHGSGVANDVSAETRMGELAAAARRVAVELTGIDTLTVGSPGQAGTVLTGVDTLTVGGRAGTVPSGGGSLTATATVVPSGASAEALIAEGRELVAEFRELLATQQRQNPRWFETPAATFAVAALSLLITLLAFVGDRVDAAGEQPTAPPPAGAPPVAPEQGGSVGGSAPGR